MVVTSHLEARPTRAVTRAVDAVLRSYAQILFSGSPAVGLLLLLATAFAPTGLLAGLLAVVVAHGTARAVGLSPELTRSGLFGYNALLLGLGGAALLGGAPGAWLPVLVAVVASVLVTAAVHSALGAAFALPALTFPFVLVFYALLGAAPALGFALQPLAAPSVAGVGGYFESLGAIFFDPRPVTGVVIAAALLLHSRIGALLSVLGYAVAAAVAAALPEAAPAGIRAALGYNALLTALGLGGVFFVPGRAAFVLGAGGALAAVAITLGLAPILGALHLPALILPFNLAMVALLYAMRQRVRDAAPKAVDFAPGSPEQNLGYYQSRVARFGARYAVRLTAPFLGRWTCTQGVDGEHTHRGAWRHGLDFEVHGEDGEPFAGDGRRLEAYHCYRLPVIAAAAGTVARVIDGLPDNPIGAFDLENNWGNVVVVYHAPGLYSLVAHLSPGSIRVREGQTVLAGEELGRCGSSGRAPAPHLHFQLQGTPNVGAPTLPVELHDVVLVGDDGTWLRACHVPREGETLRRLEPRAEVARLLAPRLGRAFTLVDDDAGQRERLVAEIDLLGRLTLRSLDRDATLYCDHQPDRFTAFDTVGDRGSVLHRVQLALARVPFEGATGLRWTDVLPARRALPWGLGPVFDLVAPFLGTGGVQMTHDARREDGALVVAGHSQATDRAGRPLVRTRAELRPGVGIETIEITLRGRTRRLRRAGAAV